MNSSCILIIGSTGFIGKSLYSSIIDKSNLYTISRSSIDSTQSTNHFSLDISEEKKLRQILYELNEEYKKIKIFFLAGETSVESSIESPESAINQSITSFTNFLNLLKNINASVVVASSGAIYDSRYSDYFNEKDSLFPPSPYAAIKYAKEGIAMSYIETFKLDIRIARIFSVFGENMNRFFIYDVVKKLLLAKKQITLKGSGNQGRDYLYVDDVSNGLKSIMDDGHAGEVYNLSSGRIVSLNKLAESIRNVLELDHLKIVWDNHETAGVRDVWYGDNRKIKAISFKPQDNFDSSLRSTVLALEARISKDSVDN